MIPVQIVPAPSALQVRKSGGGGLSSSAAGGAARAPGASATAPIAHATTAGMVKRNMGLLPFGCGCHQPTAAPGAAKQDQHPSTPVLTPVLAAASRERSRCVAQRPGVGSPNESAQPSSPPSRWPRAASISRLLGRWLRPGRRRASGRRRACSRCSTRSAAGRRSPPSTTRWRGCRMAHSGSALSTAVHEGRRLRGFDDPRHASTAGPTSHLRGAGRGTNSALTACVPCTRRF